MSIHGNNSSNINSNPFSLRNLLVFAVLIFTFLSCYLFIQHEMQMVHPDKAFTLMKSFILASHKSEIDILTSNAVVNTNTPLSSKLVVNDSYNSNPTSSTKISIDIVSPSITSTVDSKKVDHGLNTILREQETFRHNSTKGTLVCGGVKTDSEIIYWKNVPGDSNYESPITPHHDEHHDRYLSFEYDAGGWNNVRMGVEIMLVVAHAMGRTLVLPPQQHLYLLGQTHKGKEDVKAHDEMGFEDFYDISLLKSQTGLHVIHMKEFIQNEALQGGLHGIYPPKNTSSIWGRELWKYMFEVADIRPLWQGKVIAFPNQLHDHNLTKSIQSDPSLKNRLEKFLDGRQVVYYDDSHAAVHHIHVPGDHEYRIIQHFYDSKMQSFYKRFIRDYMRYKDEIQCAGAELVAAVRKGAASVNNGNSDYYALHIRRGDLQFKEVKIGASEMLENLKYPDGTPIIPSGSVVYLSTDDPQGVCANCLVNRKSCDTYSTPKPIGCPEDPSWDAFKQFGWKIRFLHNYLDAGFLKDVNPNVYGMVESIVCSRAKKFAGTYFSTFTGYIHRLRGYHGLGEETYYHYKKHVFKLKEKGSLGHGWSREYRTGWTDDEQGLDI